jgi:predicted O-methyltransferase YrrM
MKSSYTDNNYGELIEALVRVYQPQTCVELGCLEGYSSVHIARGLKRNGFGTLAIIDLFEDYAFNSSEQTVLQKNLAQYEVEAYCEIIKGSAFDEANRFADQSVDFLHADISNDGERLQQIFNVWSAKLSAGAVILLEGGSKERDTIEWMTRFKKKSIREFYETPAFKDHFEHFVFDPFPSITICKKRA